MEIVKKYLFICRDFLRSLFSDRKVVKWLIIFGIPVILGIIAVFATYIHFLPELPSLSQLEQINPKLVTNIYDMNGKIAHEYYV
ncbi:MAG: hypothetical protein VZQ99_11850, partial [Treponema sp.]|nr:hypothetical protein [Treponema sp.]